MEEGGKRRQEEEKREVGKTKQGEKKEEEEKREETGRKEVMLGLETLELRGERIIVVPGRKRILLPIASGRLMVAPVPLPAPRYFPKWSREEFEPASKELSRILKVITIINTTLLQELLLGM